MSTGKTLRLDSHNSGETEKLAARLAANLRGGEIVELKSDLGGGKTTFTRGLVAGLGSNDHVSSPTFTISKEYHADKFRILHFDFYRLSDPVYVAEALAEAMLDASTICILEWAETVSRVLPAERIIIALERTASAENDRSITITVPQEDYLKGLAVK